MESTEDKRPGHPGHPEPLAHREVMVTIDGKKVQILRGTYPVKELKSLLGVDPTYSIDELVDGKLTPLAEDAHVTIRGGEAFFSHVPTGGSSS